MSGRGTDRLKKCWKVVAVICLASPVGFFQLPLRPPLAIPGQAVTPDLKHAQLSPCPGLDLNVRTMSAPRTVEWHLWPCLFFSRSFHGDRPVTPGVYGGKVWLVYEEVSTSFTFVVFSRPRTTAVRRKSHRKTAPKSAKQKISTFIVGRLGRRFGDDRASAEAGDHLGMERSLGQMPANLLPLRWRAALHGSFASTTSMLGLLLPSRSEFSEKG